MAQPVWITPVGSVGTIPNGIFYQQSLMALTPTVYTATCTATSSVTNLVTCSSTQGIFAGLNVMFTGNTLGGTNDFTRYFVLSVVDSTHFSISAAEQDTIPVVLTTDSGVMTATFSQHIFYKIIAGSLPNGIQCSDNGSIAGIPDTLASLQGVPLEVGANTTSKFTVRAYTVAYPGITANITDRTFELTVVISPGPFFITPAGEIARYYDSSLVDFQFEFTESYTPNTTMVELFSGELPGGLTLNANGFLTGYIQPTPNVDGVPGFELTPEYTQPYDFVFRSQSKNFQFTLKVTDGYSSELRTFSMYVYSRDQMSADTTLITGDDGFVTADAINLRAPFLINAIPGNLGNFRSNNYFAHQFVGENYNPVPITYAISVNQGVGLPPGIVLDPVSGWYYGYIPDQGTTQIEYSFNVVVYQSEYIGDPIYCSSTQSSYDDIVCDDTQQLGIGQPLIFTGAAFGGVAASAQTVYYVKQIISKNRFRISANPNLQTTVKLTDTTGAMFANLILSSQVYPFSLTITGAVDAEVIWTTPDDLGTISNGSTSMLQVQAVNRGGRTILYRLANGVFNSLPQGLELLPSGEIAGRMSFDTFSQDLGLTTFDQSVSVNRNTDSLETTFDSTYEFTVNAYAPDTNQLIYEVDSVQVVNSGTGYSNSAQPTIEFSSPIGASAITARAGVVTSVTGGISGVSIVDQTGGFACNTTTALVVGVQVTVAGVMAGTGSIVGYVNSSVYYIVSTNGSSSFVLSSAKGGTPIVTTTGTTTLAFTPTTGILSVAVAEKGNGYTGATGQPGAATAVIVQGFGGSGAVLEPVMKVNGAKDVISVYKTFTLKVLREYNKPYQNLYVKAMPPVSSRALVRTLLENTSIFPPQYLYRPDDVNFGKSRQVTYAHAFGLNPDTFERYVESLSLNHYWKQLVLGQIETARALDAQGNVIYEVVYSRIIDNLANSDGDSVSKIVTLPYAIKDPRDSSSVINSVYPNSLVNMRDQVIDVVGQTAPVLPIWMTSKQSNGRVLGFVPAWVIAYTQPGRAAEIAYLVQTQFGNQLNQVQFDVDRYILDRALSHNWDPSKTWYLGPPENQVEQTGNWTPDPSLTTFDRVTTDTVFDHNSLKFAEPVDMYNPTDVYDKYLIFPKRNILV